MKVRSYRFRVMGKGYFPTDMLRYDHCFPADTDSVVRIGKNHTDYAVLTLASSGTPTIDRWKSFGWAVLEVKEIKA